MFNKKFSIIVFLNSTVVFALIAILSFITAAGVDEGTVKETLLNVFFVRLFDVCRFPMFVLLGEYISYFNLRLVFLWLLIDSMFYGIVLERLIAFIRKQKK